MGFGKSVRVIDRGGDDLIQSCQTAGRFANAIFTHCADPDRSGMVAQTARSGMCRNKFPGVLLYGQQLEKPDPAVMTSAAAGGAAGPRRPLSVRGVLRVAREKPATGGGRGSASPALQTNAPDQALRHRRAQGRGKEVRAHPEIEQTRHRLGGIVGV